MSCENNEPVTDPEGTVLLLEAVLCRAQCQGLSCVSYRCAFTL